MITASTFHSIALSARTLALAGTLTIASVLPTAGLVYADAGTSPTSTPDANQPILTQEQAFDVDPAGGLENVQAVVVAQTGGVPLLAEPSANADVVESVPSGTTVLLEIDIKDSAYSEDGVTRYWPVDVGGTSGWINGQSLMSPEDYAAYSATADDSTPGTTDTSATRVPFDFTSDTAERIAEVDADGEGLTMRADPDASSPEVASLSDGTIVDLRIDDVDTVYDAAGTRWWPVSYDGVEGWVSGFYLITPGAPSQSADAPQAPAPATRPTTPAQPTQPAQPALQGDYTYVAGDWAVVRTADSGRTDLFSSASTDAATTGTIPHMALVEVLAQAPNGWYEVRWDTVQGFIPGDLLTAGTAPRRVSDAVDPAPTPTPAAVSTETADPVETEAMAAGDTAVANSESDAGVNVRESADSGAERLGSLDDNARVTVVEGPSQDDAGNDWYKVTGNDLEGWVRADLLTQVISTSTETTGTADDGTVSDAGFSLPLASYRFTQDYGCSDLGFYSYDPNFGCSVHDGVDLAAPQGTALLAAADGTVLVSGWCNCGLGFYVEIDHGDGLHTIYGHMAGQPSVAVGDTISRGDQIGQVGSTGLSTGPHVHFMVRQDGVTVDPKSFLPPITTNAT